MCEEVTGKFQARKHSRKISLTLWYTVRNGTGTGNFLLEQKVGLETLMTNTKIPLEKKLK
jgi:hypothetical protein